MAYVDDLAPTTVIPLPVTETGENFRDLAHLLGFAAVGLFFSILSMALTSAEWLP